MLSFKITTQTQDHLQNILNKFSRTFVLLNGQVESDLEEVHRFARISTIGASTRIENALLTDNEIGWMDTVLSHTAVTTAFQENKSAIVDKLSKDRERSIEEVAGCRRMLYIIYQQGKDFIELKEAEIRGLHNELLSEYHKSGLEKGRYKTLPNYVVEKSATGQEVKVVFRTADAGTVTNLAMKELVDWYNKSRKEPGMSLAIATEFVYRFLAIHPFQDGNGRLGRGLFLLLLLQSPDEIISTVSRYLALDRHIEKAKEEYYIVLNKVSGGSFKKDPSEYRIEYFFRFMLRVIGDALDDVVFYINQLQSLKEISVASQSVYRCFKEHPEIRISTQSIIADTGLPRRTVVYALGALVKKGLLQKYGQGASTKYQLTF